MLVEFAYLVFNRQEPCADGSSKVQISDSLTADRVFGSDKMAPPVPDDGSTSGALLPVASEFDHAVCTPDIPAGRERGDLAGQDRRRRERVAVGEGALGISN